MRCSNKEQKTQMMKKKKKKTNSVMNAVFEGHDLPSTKPFSFSFSYINIDTTRKMRTMNGEKEKNHPKKKKATTEFAIHFKEKIHSSQCNRVAYISFQSKNIWVSLFVASSLFLCHHFAVVFSSSSSSFSFCLYINCKLLHFLSHRIPCWFFLLFALPYEHECISNFCLFVLICWRWGSIKWSNDFIFCFLSLEITWVIRLIRVLTRSVLVLSLW